MTQSRPPQVNLPPQMAEVTIRGVLNEQGSSLYFAYKTVNTKWETIWLRDIPAEDLDISRERILYQWSWGDIVLTDQNGVFVYSVEDGNFVTVSGLVRPTFTIERLIEGGFATVLRYQAGEPQPEPKPAKTINAVDIDLRGGICYSASDFMLTPQEMADLKATEEEAENQ